MSMPLRILTPKWKKSKRKNKQKGADIRALSIWLVNFIPL